ncbi:MAG TPA: NUDIX domain-containing protein [Flavobacteriales bacterium]|jgi:predicted NUDIX family NTP pyrophosphohydrolase|nr:NUDIX domain-containing protein [Flavobacteriales bacterium]
MAKQSAGILLYRFVDGEPEVLLVHPGGPFWRKKDLNAWSIPKGEIEKDELPEQTAVREFKEETGADISLDKAVKLPEIIQKGGKKVYAWAVEGNLDPNSIKSNLFDLEWPPKSGQIQQFPEIDKAAWFDLPTAKEKMLESQQPLLEYLEKIIQTKN